MADEFIGIDLAAMRAQVLAALGETMRDPVDAIKVLFGYQPWRMQRAIIRSTFEKPWTSVKACHSSGKTSVASRTGLAWATMYQDGIVVTTAPTWTQVEKVMWGEILSAVQGATIQYPAPNKTELTFEPKNYMMGLSTNDAVRFQGWHGNILLILDEAPGVFGGVYEAIEGIRAGGRVHVLELGNPIVIGGEFYNSFTTKRKYRSLFTISAFDTPNFDDVYLDTAAIGRFEGEEGHYFVGAKSGQNRINLLTMTEAQLHDNALPYLTTRAWVREKFDTWGPTHPLWQSKVMGEFPDQSERSLIPLAWAERARQRLPERAA